MTRGTRVRTPFELDRRDRAIDCSEADLQSSDLLGLRYSMIQVVLLRRFRLPGVQFFHGEATS